MPKPAMSARRNRSPPPGTPSSPFPAGRRGSATRHCDSHAWETGRAPWQADTRVTSRRRRARDSSIRQSGQVPFPAEQPSHPRRLDHLVLVDVGPPIITDTRIPSSVRADADLSDDAIFRSRLAEAGKGTILIPWLTDANLDSDDFLVRASAQFAGRSFLLDERRSSHPSRASSRLRRAAHRTTPARPR